MAGVDVIISDLKRHPRCPHGPTLLFSRKLKEGKSEFFACSACRDRKYCQFFVWRDRLEKLLPLKRKSWEKDEKKFLKNINHRKIFLTMNKVLCLPSCQRYFCLDCSSFQFEEYLEKHTKHKMIKNITEHQLLNPSTILPPLEDSKKEAQYLFSRNSVNTISDILKSLNYRNIICIGAPRIHEFICNECPTINSLLLDFDDRYHNFFGPMQFCWYNIFNHHFFFQDAREIFEEFLKSENIALIMDPPFGGRVEPLTETLKTIDNQFKSLNKVKSELPVFWVFPYFMEPQINNSLPNYSMLDYKVDYDNHPLFQDGPKGRKQGSPVRIFTNISPSLIKLPEEEGYRYCEECRRWVSPENKHCHICNSCTSKDGRTYKHCNLCNRCVKPTWQHCEECSRCAVENHKCTEVVFKKECFHCKKEGHKKAECPNLNNVPSKKRKNLQKNKPNKKQKKHKTI